MSALFSLLRTMALAFVLLPAACSSPDPNLYTIAPVSGPKEYRAPRVVLVRDVVVARYLDRTHIVRSSQDYRLAVLSNDWWGEPLAGMISRVLVQELQQRLPESIVYRISSPVDLAPDATVNMNIDQLDEDAAGRVVLRGLVSVTFKGRRSPVVRPVRFVVAPTTPGTAGEVAASSAAVGQLADALATDLAGARR